MRKVAFDLTIAYMTQNSNGYMPNKFNPKIPKLESTFENERNKILNY